MKDKLRPNLYTMLIGPSGAGKNVAIERALRLANCVPALRDRTIRGKLTAPRLLDILGGRMTVKTDKGGGKVEKLTAISQPWIVYPELYMSIGSGPQAEAFITHLTDMYGGSPIPIREGTRMWGDVVIENPCINWLSGTTRAWLEKSMTPDAIDGGFFARVVAIEAPYTDERIADPTSPDDSDEVMEYLVRRLEYLTVVEGEMVLDADAREIRRQWYEGRPKPTEESMLPAWKRDDDLAYKLSMLFSLADDNSMVINKHHVSAAQKWVLAARESMPRLVSMTHSSEKSKMLAMLANFIRGRVRVSRVQTQRYMNHKGVMARELDTMTATLIQAEQIRSLRTPTGSVYYEWIERRRQLPLDDD